MRNDFCTANSTKARSQRLGHVSVGKNSDARLSSNSARRFFRQTLGHIIPARQTGSLQELPTHYPPPPLSLPTRAAMSAYHTSMIFPSANSATCRPSSCTTASWPVAENINMIPSFFWRSKSVNSTPSLTLYYSAHRECVRRAATQWSYQKNARREDPTSRPLALATKHAAMKSSALGQQHNQSDHPHHSDAAGDTTLLLNKFSAYYFLLHDAKPSGAALTTPSSLTS